MRRRVNCSTDSFLALLVVVVLLISGQHPLLAVHNKATTSATTSTSQLSNPAVPRDSLRPPLPLPLPPSSSTSSSSSSPLLHAHIAASGTKKYAHDDAKESNHTKSRLTTFLTGIWNSILSMAELNVHLHENAYGQVDSSRYPVSRSSGVSRLLVNHNINPISSSGKDDDIKSKVGAQSTTSSSTQNHYKLKSPRPSRARQNSRGEPDETVAAQPNVGGTTSPSFLRRSESRNDGRLRGIF